MPDDGAVRCKIEAPSPVLTELAEQVREDHHLERGDDSTSIRTDH